MKTEFGWLLPFILLTPLGASSGDRVIREEYLWTLRGIEKGMSLEWNCSVEIGNRLLTDWNEIPIPCRNGRVSELGAIIHHQNGKKEHISPIRLGRDGSPNLKSHGVEDQETLIFPGLTDHCRLELALQIEWDTLSDQEIVLLSNTYRNSLIVSIKRSHFSGIGIETLVSELRPGAIVKIGETQPVHHETSTFDSVTWSWHHLPAWPNEPFSPQLPDLGGMLHLPFKLILEKPNSTSLLRFHTTRLKGLVDSYSIPMNLDLFRLCRNLSKKEGSLRDFLVACFRFLALDVRNIKDLNLVRQGRGNIIKDIYGHPYQKINMLRAMLRTKNIESRLEFFLPRYEGALTSENVSSVNLRPMLHIHLEGHEYYLAPYLKTSHPDILPDDMKGAAALVFDQKTQSARITELPWGESSAVKEDIKIQIRDIDSYHVSNQLTLSQIFLEQFLYQRTFSPENWCEKLIEKRFKSIWKQFKLKQVTLNSEKGVLKFEYELEQYVSRNKSTLALCDLNDFCLFPPPVIRPLREPRLLPFQTQRDQEWITSWDIEVPKPLQYTMTPLRDHRVTNEYGSLAFKADLSLDALFVERCMKLTPHKANTNYSKQISQINAIYSPHTQLFFFAFQK